MPNPSPPKSLLPPLSFMKSPPLSSSSSLTLSSSKLKTVLQTFLLSHLYRISRTLTKAKALVIQLVKNSHVINIIEYSIRKKDKDKLYLKSFRLHYNWCSSHMMPVPVIKRLCSDVWSYDSSWNTVLSSSGSCDDERVEDDDTRLSGYLHWLEQKADGLDVEDPRNEIDRLADMFIAESHEKFRLEKEESYRKFQEMMARSV